MIKRFFSVALSVLLISQPMSAPADVSNVEATKVTDVIEVVEVETTSLGIFKLTAYCKENYPHICNNGDSSSTATGTVPTVGRTVAIDPSIIPYGSEVIINGHTYIAEDCGGAIKENRVDILMETHKEALEFGVQYAEVSIRKDIKNEQ